MSELTKRIAENVARVQERIDRAAERSGRTGGAVTLVAVTKYVGLEEVRAVLDSGCRVLGESRPQQLWEKAAALPDVGIDWHMIGHLQRNKVRRTLPVVRMVQSVDSLRLIETIDREAEALDHRVPILLEVNVSGEEAKHGFEPEDVEPLLDKLADYGRVDVRGLMCMAAFAGTRESARADFAALRRLRDRLRINCPDTVELDELSMGMSGDFEAAIEEGATLVRVGSVLFEGLL